MRRLRWDAEGPLREIERKDDVGSFAAFMTYAYHSDDNRTREVDALGRVTAHAFDPLRRLTSTTDAAASPNVTYDESGNLTETGDTDYSASSPTLESTVYDELDRPSARAR